WTGRPVLAHINHPNFGKAMTWRDVAAVRADRFFEVFNGHRSVLNDGDADTDSTTAIWDKAMVLRLLDLGLGPLYGLATDDAHHYHQPSQVASPGRGWVMVRAKELAADALVRALQAGDFYSSSGVEVADFEITDAVYRVVPRPREGEVLTTRFLGARVAGDALDAAMEGFSVRPGRGPAHFPRMNGLSIDWVWDALGVTAFTLETDGPRDVAAASDPRWFALRHLLQVAEELPRARSEPAAHSPVLVTAATRADADELARLQAPGAVLFRDDFDDAASLERYFELLGRDRGRIAIAAADGYGGTGALQLTTEDRGGEACGAGVRLWLDEGQPLLHLRYRIRYAADYDQGNLNHTGGSISGVAGDDRWRGMGTAGLRPAGDDYCSTRVEGWRDWQRVAAPGFLHSYTYWQDMARDRDGHFWGNMLMPVAAERCVPRRDHWLCVEQRLALDTPGGDEGELAVWLDGVLYMHWRGIRWRSSPELLCRRISLDLYVHESRQQNRVWYDDLVVSTGYVGP
ncbi:MAG: hypothetical protein KDE27_21350, partial [Planctomycetes bacterium]|nr:hypothetical protein [Planctomycetota bacterium]